MQYDIRFLSYALTGIRLVCLGNSNLSKESDQHLPFSFSKLRNSCRVTTTELLSSPVHTPPCLSPKILDSRQGSVVNRTFTPESGTSVHLDLRRLLDFLRFVSKRGQRSLLGSETLGFVPLVYSGGSEDWNN